MLQTYSKLKCFGFGVYVLRKTKKTKDFVNKKNPGKTSDRGAGTVQNRSELTFRVVSRVFQTAAARPTPHLGDRTGKTATFEWLGGFGGTTGWLGCPHLSIWGDWGDWKGTLNNKPKGTKGTEGTETVEVSIWTLNVCLEHVHVQMSHSIEKLHFLKCVDISIPGNIAQSWNICSEYNVMP